VRWGVRALVLLPSLVVGLAFGTAASARPNLVLMVTDDQRWDTVGAMPTLQREVAAHGVEFENAFVVNALCCPSRASILTGLYSHNTGVYRQAPPFGRFESFDDSVTVATMLQEAGYRTGFFGKYIDGGQSEILHGYVPPGWDEWVSFVHAGYSDYGLSVDGTIVDHGSAPEDYSTDVYAHAAADFIRTAPEGRPFFLMFTPMAPHSPWTPAARDAGSWTGPVTTPPSFDERDVADKPAWVQRLPPLTERRQRQLREDHRHAYETLGALEFAVLEVLAALQARRALDDTVVVFLTDNGFSFGEHRWFTKSCPYDDCIRTPFFVRYPGADARSDPHPVSNVDLAPTIAALADASLRPPVDGRSLLPLLLGRDPRGWRPGVLSEFQGGRDIPGWWEMRTPRYAYVEYVTGERELYDVAGSLGPADPYELRNVAGSSRFAEVQDRLAADLRAARAG